MDAARRFEEQQLEALEVDDDGWAVWTLNDDGLATRLEFYLDHQEAEALEAAGLPE